VLEQGVGQAQVAFGVLEVDRVDLVRHGARTDLAGLELLLEVTQRDIAPDIARQVDQDVLLRAMASNSSAM
jgi:glutathione S-transferase